MDSTIKSRAVKKLIDRIKPHEGIEDVAKFQKIVRGLLKELGWKLFELVFIRTKQIEYSTCSSLLITSQVRRLWTPCNPTLKNDTEIRRKLNML